MYLDAAATYQKPQPSKTGAKYPIAAPIPADSMYGFGIPAVNAIPKGEKDCITGALDVIKPHTAVMTWVVTAFIISFISKVFSFVLTFSLKNYHLPKILPIHYRTSIVVNFVIFACSIMENKAKEKRHRSAVLVICNLWGRNSIKILPILRR